MEFLPLWFGCGFLIGCILVWGISSHERLDAQLRKTKRDRDYYFQQWSESLQLARDSQLRCERLNKQINELLEVIENG